MLLLWVLLLGLLLQPSVCCCRWVLVEYAVTPNLTYEACHDYGPGVYNVTLRCYNRCAYFMTWVVTCVRKAVRNVAMTTATYHAFGDDIVLDWSYDDDANATVTAFVDGVEVTSGVATGMTVDDVTNGTLTLGASHAGRNPAEHRADIFVSNCVSNETFSVTFYVEENITGLTLTANGQGTTLFVSTDTPVTLQATVITGTHGTYYFHNGLNEVSVVNAERTPTSRGVFQYATTETGVYTATVRAVNNITDVTAQMTIVVENPIRPDLTLSYSNVSSSADPVDFTFTLAAVAAPEFGPTPTDIVASYDFGEPAGTFAIVDAPMTIVREVMTPTTAAVPHVQQHTYSTDGDYAFTAFIRNNVSNLTLTASVRVGKPVDPFSVAVVNPTGVACLDPQNAVDFNVTFGGSNVTFVYSWGHDNVVDVEVISSGFQQSSFVRSHTYSTDGVYLVKMDAGNAFGTTRQDIDFRLGYPFPPSIAMATGHHLDISPGIFAINFTRDANQFSPTNATCDVYKDGAVATAFDLDLGPDKTVAGKSTYDWDVTSYGLGEFDFTVNCTTCNDAKSWTGSVFLQAAISGLSVTLDASVQVPGVNVCASLSVATGSHVNFTATFAPGETQHSFDASAKTASLCHAFASDGIYFVQVLAANDLNSETSSVTATIEYAVPALTLTTQNAAGTLISVPASGTLDVDYDVAVASGVTQGPTNATCTWHEFVGSTGTAQGAPELYTLQASTYRVTYTKDSNLGDQVVSAVCCNLINCVNANLSVVLNVPIASVTLQPSTYVVGINVPMTLTATATPPEASHTNFLFDHGDGTSQSLYVDGRLDENGGPRTVTVTFTSEGRYTPSVSVWNAVATSNATDTLATPIAALKTLDLNDLTFAHATVIPYQTDVTLTVTSAFPYINTFVRITWIDAQETEVAEATWPLARSFTYSGAHSHVGLVPLVFFANNTVSTVRWEGNVTIKQPPVLASFTLQNAIKTNEDGNGTVTLTQGSHLSLTATCEPLGGATGCSADYATASTPPGDAVVLTWHVPLRFSQPGRYAVAVNVSNEFAVQTDTQTIGVFNPILDFDLSATTGRELDGEYYVSFREASGAGATDVTLSLSVSNDCAYPPTNVTLDYHVDPPGGATDVDTSGAVELSCTPHTVTQPLATIGEYVVTTNVTNEVSSGHDVIRVTAQNPIINMQLTALDAVSQDGDLYRYPYLGAGATSVTMQLVVDNACAHPPTDVTGTLHIDYNVGTDHDVTESALPASLQCTSSPQTFTRPFDYVGTYVVTVNGTNNVGDVSDVIEIFILVPVHDNFNISLSPPGIPPDNQGNPVYPVQTCVNVTADHGSPIACYHEYACVDRDGDDGDGRNCDFRTPAGNTSTWTQLCLAYPGLYTLRIKVRRRPRARGPRSTRSPRGRGSSHRAPHGDAISTEENLTK